MMQANCIREEHMSFDVSSTGYKGMSEGNPADQVTGNTQQPKPDDKTSGSKLASVVKGISAHCDGVNVQLAPPDLGNPTVADSGKTEERADGEKAENKSSGGTKMTVGSEEKDVEEKEKLKEFAKSDPDKAYDIACKKGWYDVAKEINDMTTDSEPDAEEASKEKKAEGTADEAKAKTDAETGSHPQTTMPPEA
jgi:hypothetical protein